MSKNVLYSEKVTHQRIMLKKTVWFFLVEFNYLITLIALKSCIFISFMCGVLCNIISY